MKPFTIYDKTLGGGAQRHGRRGADHGTRGACATKLCSAFVCAFFIFTISALGQTTQVLFPVNYLFGGAAYNKPITIAAANTLISDGQNLWAGTYTIIPASTTNPIVSLYPNTYLMTVAGVVKPARFTVPASTNVLDVTTLLTSGPLFYFGSTNWANLVAGTNVTFVTNADGSIAISSSGGGAGGGVTNNQVLPGMPSSTNGTFAGSFSGTLAGAFTGNGSGLTNLQAGALTGAITASYATNAGSAATAGVATNAQGGWPVQWPAASITNAIIGVLAPGYSNTLAGYMAVNLGGGSYVLPFYTNVYYFNPETLSFGANVTNNAGTISASDLQAIDTFVYQVKAIDCFTDLLDVCFFAGNSTNAAVVKFKNLPGSPINLNLSASMTANMYARGYGWRNTNDGTARWFDTGVNIGTMMTNSQYGAVVYITSRPGALNNSSGGLFGYWFASPYTYNFSGDNGIGNNNGFGDDCYWGGSYVQVAGPTISKGIIGVEQSATNQTVLWMGDDPVATNAATFSTSGNNNLFQLLDSQSSSANNFQGSIGFYALTDGQMGYAKYKQFIVAVHTLMVSLGRDAPSPLPCWCVPVTGQSLSVGAAANFALSTNFPSYNIFTSDGGPIIYNGSYFPQTGVVPCRENALSIGSAGVESPCTSWMTEAASLGLTNVNLFSVASGLGGAGYTLISNGTPAFLENSNAVANCVNWTNLLFTNGVISPAVMAVQAEADLGNPVYQADMQQWVADYNTAFHEITGQTNVVKMFHSQPSAYSNTPAPLSPLAMFYETIKVLHSNILVCAKYNLEYSTNGDHIHLDCYGYQQMGEYYGKAFYQEMVNGRWEPLRPDVANITRTNTTVYVPFLGATGGLVFDTNNTCNYGGTNTQYKWPNYGFGFTNLLGTSPAITNVTLWNSNTVALTLNSLPSGSSNFVTYAFNAGVGVNADGYTGGTTNMPGGNLRDQDPTIGALSGKRLWDWCVLFMAQSP